MVLRSRFVFVSVIVGRLVGNDSFEGKSRGDEAMACIDRCRGEDDDERKR